MSSGGTLPAMAARFSICWQGRAGFGAIAMELLPVGEFRVFAPTVLDGSRKFRL